MRLDPRIPCKKTQVGGCGPFWVSIEYFTSAPFTNSYDRGGFFFPTDTGCRSANVAFVFVVFVVSEEEEEEEEEEINLFSMVFFLPHEDDKKRLVLHVVVVDRKRRDREDAEVLVLAAAAAGRVVLAIAVATIARARGLFLSRRGTQRGRKTLLNSFFFLSFVCVCVSRFGVLQRRSCTDDDDDDVLDYSKPQMNKRKEREKREILESFAFVTKNVITTFHCAQQQYPLALCVCVCVCITYIRTIL